MKIYTIYHILIFKYIANIKYDHKILNIHSPAKKNGPLNFNTIFSHFQIAINQQIITVLRWNKAQIKAWTFLLKTKTTKFELQKMFYKMADVEDNLRKMGNKFFF